jgi:NADH-quinone oxidoreductase subunit H
MLEFFNDYVWPVLVVLVQSVLLLVILLIAVAYIIYADRKIWAAVQIRRGPNVVGPWGLLQSFADLLKFVLKEPVVPSGANKGLFLLAPFVTCVLALAAWAVIPVDEEWVIANINVGILYIFAISSLGVYGIIMAGWASNSKYPFLAALRSAAQMVSYEVSIGFVIITVLLCVGSLNLSEIVEAQNGQYGMFSWFWLPLLPMFVIFFVSALAETNRPPFDLVEAESELVAGFMVEYGSTPYMMLMLGEYVAISTMCAMATIMFLGGWLAPFPVPPFTWVPGVIWFVLKCLFMFFLFAMAKAIVPRYRYDQLMRLGWKVFLPISLAMVVIVAGVLQYMGLAPRCWERTVDISLAGLLGAIAGTVLAAVNYYVIIGVLEKAMREGAKTAEERDGIETKLSLVRRLILVVDLFVFAGIGYWLGYTFWG